MSNKLVKLCTTILVVACSFAAGLACSVELYRSEYARDYAYGLSETYCWNGIALDWHDGRFCSAVYMIVGDY